MPNEHCSDVSSPFTGSSSLDLLINILAYSQALYKPSHLCHEKQGIITISFDSTGIITCNNCSVKLNSDEIRSLDDRLSYCICKDCGYKDETHLFLHKKNGNLTCPRCSFNKKNASQSTNDKLKDEKFKCDVCVKSFRSKGHLNRHRLTHFGAKPYLCENCGTGFNQRSTLKTHTLIHKKVNPFSCKWCGQQFRHKQTLLNHTMSIHGYVSEVGSLYECDKCKKKFINKAKLRRHYRSHSGEKPFKCNICDKTFSQNVNLKTHYKKHEAENQFPNIPMYSPQSVLNDAEQGKLIQELFTDCQQLNLGLDNITSEQTSFDSEMQKSYGNNQDINLKAPSSSNAMYYDISSSYDLMYSDDTNLYDANVVSKSSMLPTFSTLSAVPLNEQSI